MIAGGRGIYMYIPGIIYYILYIFHTSKVYYIYSLYIFITLALTGLS